MAVLFIGVAASSSFQHVSELSLSPGQSTRVGAYAVRYVRPTATLTPRYDPTHTGSMLNIGAVLRVTKHGRYVTTLRPSEDFYESQEASQGSVGHLIGGQPVSSVGINAGLTRDIWSAIAPEIETPRLKRIVAIGNEKIPMTRPDEGLIAIDVLAHEYLQHPPPAQFHLLVSPLVMWIWIGGLIVFGGGLLALSPSLGSLRRRAALRVRGRPTGRLPAFGGRAVAEGAALAPAELAALERAREVKYRELREARARLRHGQALPRGLRGHRRRPARRGPRDPRPAGADNRRRGARLAGLRPAAPPSTRASSGAGSCFRRTGPRRRRSSG